MIMDFLLPVLFGAPWTSYNSEFTASEILRWPILARQLYRGASSDSPAARPFRASEVTNVTRAHLPRLPDDPLNRKTSEMEAVALRYKN